MQTVLMYSYKGGAGRTTATANVGAVLAKEFKRRVLCVDLDIESAGLGIVFGLHSRIHEPDRRCLQDVLREGPFLSDKQFEEWWPQLHFDVVRESSYAPIGGELLFIPARAAHHEAVIWKGTSGRADPWVDLMTKIRLHKKPDFVLIDSASGLTDPAVVGLQYVHWIVAFLRWNRQFLEGTLEAVQFILGKTQKVVRLDNIEKILLVPTAVPELRPGQEELERLLEASQRRLRTELEIEREERIELLQAIPESSWLKWYEKVLPFEPELNEDQRMALEGYRRVARWLVETSDRASEARRT